MLRLPCSDIHQVFIVNVKTAMFRYSQSFEYQRYCMYDQKINKSERDI